MTQILGVANNTKYRAALVKRIAWLAEIATRATKKANKAHAEARRAQKYADKRIAVHYGYWKRLRAYDAAQAQKRLP